MSRALSAAGLAAACTFALGAMPAFAQGKGPGGYPLKPIRFLVPFAPGGTTDLVARLVSQRLSDELGQQLVVDNRGGAGGTIAAEIVARSAGDGYTLKMNHQGMTFNATLYPKLPFDLFKDLAPVGLVTVSPMALAVNPRVKEADLRAFTANMRANPGKLSYATCGIATSHHFAFEMYKLQAKLNALHIPYRGCAAAVADAVGGQVDTVMSSLNTLLPHQAAGRLRVPIDRVLSLARTAEAHAVQELATVTRSGGLMGKIVIEP